MSEFASFRSYQLFAESVRTKWRYVRDLDREQSTFLETLLETSASRIDQIKSGSTLWRAQLGPDSNPSYDSEDEQPAPLDVQRMKPLPTRAPEGRANPKGIPCLYLSTE